MAAAKTYTMDGKEQASVKLNDRVFGLTGNEVLVHQVAVALMSARRQGNAETKTRKEIRGGGRKPFSQKGTGRARQGSSREPQMRGGGVVFGPHKRDYRKAVPLKMKRKALCIALSDRARTEQLCVLEKLAVDGGKTRALREMCTALSPEGRKTLLVTATHNEDALTAGRNLGRLNIRTASDVNLLDVLNARRVILEKGALAALEARLT